MKRKKQFIAGATCPECSDMDSLVLYADDQSVACVSCDYTKTSEQRDQETNQSTQKNSTKEIQSTKKNTNISYKDAGSIKITNLDQ